MRDGVGVGAGSVIWGRVDSGTGAGAGAWASDAVEKVSINTKRNTTWFAVDRIDVFIPGSPCLRALPGIVAFKLLCAIAAQVVAVRAGSKLFS